MSLCRPVRVSLPPPGKGQGLSLESDGDGVANSARFKAASPVCPGPPLSRESQDGRSPGTEQSVPSWELGQSQIRGLVDGWSALPRRQMSGVVAAGEGW